jgi:hypothetical protein
VHVDELKQPVPVRKICDQAVRVDEVKYPAEYETGQHQPGDGFFIEVNHQDIRTSIS